MQLKENYDLIVIGDQLSGLFLAAGAAQSGKKVLVLEESSSPYVANEIPSGKFLGDFACEPFIGIQTGNPIDQFLRSLGLYQNVDDLFFPHSPSLQIIQDRIRLDFSYDKNSLREEIGREFPTQKAEISRLLDGSVVETGSFSRAVQKVGLPTQFESYGWLHGLLYGAFADPELAYPQYKKICQLAEKSVRYPLGGRDALKERLLSRIKIFQGDLRRNTRVEEIVFEKGKLAGVLLSSYEGFVRAPYVIGAMAAENFFDLVPKQFQSEKTLQWKKRKRITGWRFQYCLLVQEKSLPEGLGSHACISLDDGFFQMQVFPRETYSGLPSGTKAVNVRLFLPAESSQISATAITRFMKRSLQQMNRHFPFLQIDQISPNPEQLSTDPIYQKFFQFPSVDHIPPLYLCYESTSFPNGEDFLEGETFGIPGLGLCSRDIYPLLGSTGEVLASYELLQRLRRRAEKKK